MKLLQRSMFTFMVSALLFSCSEKGTGNKSDPNNLGGGSGEEQTPPGIPGAVTVELSGTIATVSWATDANAQTFTIYSKEGSGVTTQDSAQDTDQSSLAFANLNYGSTYCFRVTASNEHGTSGLSPEVCATPDLQDSQAPTALSATTLSGSIELEWTVDFAVDSFLVFWKEGTGVGPGDSTLTTSDNSVSHTSLDNFTMYCYKVAVVLDGQTGPLSAEVCATSADNRPAAPTNLVAQAGNTDVVLVWNEPGAVTGYRLYYNTTGTVTTADSVVDVSEAYYRHEALTNGTDYYYRVAALNAVGEGPLSTEVMVTPSGDEPTLFASGDTFPLAIPDNDTAVGASSTIDVAGLELSLSDLVVEINISHPSLNNLDVYLVAPGGEQISLSTDNGGSGDNFTHTIFDPFAATPITSGSPPYTGFFQPEQSLASLMGTVPNGTWTLVVQDDTPGSTGQIESWSLWAHGDVLDPPSSAPGALAANSGHFQNAISWNNDGDEGLTTYNLYWNTTGGVTTADSVINVSANSYDHTGLANDQAYFYRVAAVNAAGQGPLSGEVSATPSDSGMTTAHDSGPFSNIPDGSAPPFSTSQYVSDGPTVITDVTVQIDIEHTYTGDLDISLESPNGTVIDLSSDNGGSGNNYSGTTFTDAATFSITSGSAPFSGSYRPETPLSNFDGEGANGSWTLIIDDDLGGDTGHLNYWTLHISGTGFVDPMAPTNLAAAGSDQQIEISWDAAGAATDNHIYWNTTGGVTSSDSQLTSVTSPYLHTGLVNGTMYYYRVASVVGGVERLSAEFSALSLGPVDCAAGGYTVDALFSNQWHLEGTGQDGSVVGADARVRAAWDSYDCLGDGITIAIIDDGVDLTHAEFDDVGKLVVVNGSNFNAGDPDDPQADPANGDAHGTACAGVAAAQDDGDGVTGAAPNANILPIRLIAGAVAASDEAAALYLADTNGAQILSNSWGPPDSGINVPVPAVVDSALADLAENGRGGLGSIILWAAGNGNEPISCDDDAGAGGDGICDGYASHPDVLAVAAVNDQNEKSSYSDFGPEVFIAAPSSGGLTSGIWTVDHSGDGGYYPAVLGPGTYSIEVYGYDVLSGGYTLNVGDQTSPAAETETGGFNGSAASAQAVAYPATISGSSSDTDSDYFQVVVPAGQTLEVTLIVGNFDDIDLYIYNSDGSSLLYFSEQLTGVDEVYDASLLPDAAGDYTDSFGGTSSATPLAAGIVALLLSADNSLTLDQVRWILSQSANQGDLNVGSYPFGPDGRSLAFGYGKIDAQAALAYAGNNPPSLPRSLVAAGAAHKKLRNIGRVSPNYYINKGRKVYLDVRANDEDSKRSDVSNPDFIGERRVQAVSVAGGNAIAYLSRYITVGFHKGVSANQVRAFFSEYSVEKRKRLATPGGWLVKVDVVDPLEVLAISQKMSHSSLVNYAEPDIISHRQRR